jgi:hypothetical protein
MLASADTTASAQEELRRTFASPEVSSAISGSTPLFSRNYTRNKKVKVKVNILSLDVPDSSADFT